MSNGMKTKALGMARKIIPGSIRHKLSYEMKKTQSNISHARHQRAFGCKQSGQITIVFLVYEPQTWNSLKSVFEAAVNHPDVKAYMIIAPDITGERWAIKDEVIAFFRKEAADAIPGYQDGNLFNVASLKPDLVFRQTPYDEAYPEEYSVGQIARYAKTCYVPYGYNNSPDKHLRIEYNHPFCKDLFAVFADCLSNVRYCEELKKDLYPDLHIYYEGFPRIDLLRRMEDRRDQNRYTFTWIPRWSLDSVYNDSSGFFVYKDNLLEYMVTHPDCQLIIRPHPMMFPCFIKWGVMTEEEVASFHEMIRKLPNVRMDSNFDYLKTFEETDALVADFSSLVYEFYLTGKPIIYCGSTSEYNCETQMMMNLLYKASDWNEIKAYMDALISGDDVLMNDRKKDIQSMLDDLPDNIGVSIINRCVEFCRGE